MKKILACLTLSSSLLFAGNYAMVSYTNSKTDFASNYYLEGSLEITSYGFQAYVIESDFLFRPGISYLPSQTSSFLSPSNGVHYELEADGIALGALFAYKLNLLGGIFIGPMVGASYTSLNTKFTDGGSGRIVSNDGTSSDIPLGLIFGLDYADDSFIYVSYDIDDDIKDSDDHDYHSLEFGIAHSFGTFLVDFSYAKESDAYDTYETGTTIEFGVGVQF